MFIVEVGGIRHFLTDITEEGIEAQFGSTETLKLVNEAIKSDSWKPYEPPQAEPEPPPPDWSGFRLALMQSGSFRAWSEQVPATWREDLKIAATVANLEALQAVYELIKNYYPPTVEAVAEWAELAQRYSIALAW